MTQTYHGDITVTTQEEVDALRTTLADIDTIDGNLTIGYSRFTNSRSNITDLTPLRDITHITGNLRIGQTQLVNLNALRNLQSIGRYFFVQCNHTLTTLGNFSKLKSIGMDNNVYIPSLDEFTDKVSIVVEDNSSLSDCYVLIDFLPGGAHAVSGEIYINDNATDGGCNSQNDIKIGNYIYCDTKL